MFRYWKHFGAGFASPSLLEFEDKHGPCVAAMGWKVEDADQALKIALERGAEVANNSDYQLSDGSDLPVIKGIGDSLIYFVEDDYLHKKESLKEMIFTYERIASQINNEIIICPTDYPYLYAKAEVTQNFLGDKFHWRKINETLCTFLTSKQIIEKYWDKYISMCEIEHAPFEKPMHEIYEKEYCLSPIPSLTMHATNINSMYGVPPNFDWKKIWDENK